MHVVPVPLVPYLAQEAALEHLHGLGHLHLVVDVAEARVALVLLLRQIVEPLVVLAPVCVRVSRFHRFTVSKVNEAFMHACINSFIFTSFSPSSIE